MTINQIHDTAENRNEEELISESCTIDPSSVITKFLNLKVQLEELLRLCDPIPLVKKCYSLLGSDTHNIPLFTTEYIEKLQEIKHTHELIQALSPFMTWDNHSVLSIIAEASSIPAVTMLLTQFDDRIDSSQPLTRFPIPTPSHHMVPYENSTHTILAIKLDLDLDNCTLQDVTDTQSLIEDQCSLTSFCLQLLAVAETNFTMVYWTVPKSVVHLIVTNVLQFQSYFYLKGIHQLSLYPGTMLCTGNALKVGPLSFFNQSFVLHDRQVIISYYVSYIIYIAILNTFSQKIVNTSDNLSIELSQVEVMYVATGMYNAFVAIMYVCFNYITTMTNFMYTYP